MSNLIASQISVTTGDIAKAAVGAAKKQLAAEIKTLNKKYDALRNDLKEQISDLVLQEVEKLKGSVVYADFIRCAKTFAVYDKEYDYKVSIRVADIDFTSDTFASSVFAAWSYYHFITNGADNKLSVRQNAKNPLHVDLVIYANDKKDPACTETTNCFRISTISLSPIIQDNEDNIKLMIEAWNKSIDLNNKLKGHPDSITSMTLDEEITNAITMQAVSNLPDIAAVFNTTALAGSIINGYLE